MIAKEIGFNPSNLSQQLNISTAQRIRTSANYVAANSRRKTDHLHHIKLLSCYAQMKDKHVCLLSE